MMLYELFANLVAIAFFVAFGLGVYLSCLLVDRAIARIRKELNR